MIVAGLPVCFWLGAAWILAAAAVPFLPESRRRQVALVLAVIAVPLAGLITWRHGPVWGLGGLVAATIALGLPLRHALR
ncbi:DUF2484 family protein [Ruixingdingia sedimenti]|uniref:DUF2484 family protein n=1 Tax=Ruixingdingia sedimenti TaxID=3073604 RepID=A0ABU1F530_9RHOB|nr:DUF2484 family protein [Xinfangfangia sp. LG-4]MDR5651985.1 DUF2484 family protein [Xinfangfangia sp. LG-4]